MFTCAGLECDGIHNHSLRATGISRLYNSGVPEKLIMERSGHLSASGVRSYECTSDQQQQQVSEVISKPSCSSTALQLKNEHNQTNSKVVASHSQANKENILDIKDLHGGTININFNSK